MYKNISTVISGTGSYIPSKIVNGEDFMDSRFFDKGVRLEKPVEDTIRQFAQITGINQRRYAEPEELCSDLAVRAALKALEDADIDKETLDYIILGHNFGDVLNGSNRSDLLPSLASRVKQKLDIRSPNCVAYDIIFGCPGWVQGCIQADYYIKSGDAKRVMVIGAETLSRIIDPHDRDSMIFADGAGAAIFHADAGLKGKGILAHKTRTFAVEHGNHLTMGRSGNPGHARGDRFMKMNGRKLYEFTITQVPLLIREVIDQTGLCIDEVRIVFVHQANEKMNLAIMKNLFKLYRRDSVPEKLVPMTVGYLGNSSVATVPTLLDLVRRSKVDGYHVNDGDVAVFASVGAGMNINAFVYRF